MTTMINARDNLIRGCSCVAEFPFMDTLRTNYDGAIPVNSDAFNATYMDSSNAALTLPVLHPQRCQDEEKSRHHRSNMAQMKPLGSSPDPTRALRLHHTPQRMPCKRPHSRPFSWMRSTIPQRRKPRWSKSSTNDSCRLYS